jgi:hypothetical protein
MCFYRLIFRKGGNFMTENQVKNKGGAPRGNQNARKHGFYSKTLTSRQQAMLANVVSTASLDQEIAVMRVKIASILADDPRNMTLLNRAVITLARLTRSNQQPDKHEIRALATADEVVSRLFPRNNRA